MSAVTPLRPLLRRGLAAVLLAVSLAATSCGPTYNQWQNLGLRAADRLPPYRGTIVDATCGLERTCLVLRQADGDPVIRKHAWNGTAWTAPAPGPELFKVSCGSATSCAGSR